jgi:hypothetical protein
MISTTASKPFCVYNRVKKIRLHVGDVIRHSPWYSLDLEKLNRENENLKWNIKLGNREPCRCEQCNPTSSSCR